MIIAATSLFSQFIDYFKVNSSYVMQQFFRHFLISIYGVLFAAIVAIPLGIIIARKRRLSATLIGIANVIQTVPSLAMLSILMIGLGLGVQTVIATVALYSFLPILKNTCAGILSVPEPLLDAAKGMGMTRLQRVLKVEVPLALSVIMGGIRNALVVVLVLLLSVHLSELADSVTLFLGVSMWLAVHRLYLQVLCLQLSWPSLLMYF